MRDSLERVAGVGLNDSAARPRKPSMLGSLVLAVVLALPAPSASPAMQGSGGYGLSWRRAESAETYRVDMGEGVANGTTFIGSPTMGANGDVTSFTIPGNIGITFNLNAWGLNRRSP